MRRFGERVSSGRVLLDGVDITDASDRQLTRLRGTGMRFVFQNFNLIGSLTAEQNVAMPLRLGGRRPGRHTVREVLASVGLADRAGHRPRELSGGQQQRAATRIITTRTWIGAADRLAARYYAGRLWHYTGRPISSYLCMELHDSLRHHPQREEDGDGRRQSSVSRRNRKRVR